MMNMMMLTSQLVDRDHTLAFHQAIFQAIQRHDGPEAERHMRDHLIDARALLLQARQSEADERLRKSIGKNTARKRSAVKATR
jgi:GntR family transcriptional repressor for pyruvate dehydrogenase complex